MKRSLTCCIFLLATGTAWAGIYERAPPPPSVSNYQFAVPPHFLVATWLSLTLGFALGGLGLARAQPVENGPPPLPWTLPVSALLLTLGVALLWANWHRIGYSYWPTWSMFIINPAQGTDLGGGRRQLVPGPPFEWLLLRGWAELAGFLVCWHTLCLSRRHAILQRAAVGCWFSLCNFPLLVLVGSMADTSSSPTGYLSLQPLWFSLLGALVVTLMNCSLLNLAFQPRASTFDLGNQTDNLVIVLGNCTSVLGSLCCCMPDIM